MAYACKLCIWNQKLRGGRFREAKDWFQTEDEFFEHFKKEHDDIAVKLTKESAAWPGMLEDAQAGAEGYLICYHTFEPTPIFQFTCYRCDATSVHPDDLNSLYCLSCGRTYTNFYQNVRFKR